jgi:hypothetical protein
MTFVIEQSKPSLNKSEDNENKSFSYLDKLLSVKVFMSPIELFSLRFDFYPSSFYPLEMLTKSSVTA